jgi:hypothetical protein
MSTWIQMTQAVLDNYRYLHGFTLIKAYHLI